MKMKVTLFYIIIKKIDGYFRAFVFHVLWQE